EGGAAAEGRRRMACRDQVRWGGGKVDTHQSDRGWLGFLPSLVRQLQSPQLAVPSAHVSPPRCHPRQVWRWVRPTSTCATQPTSAGSATPPRSRVPPRPNPGSLRPNNALPRTCGDRTQCPSGQVSPLPLSQMDWIRRWQAGAPPTPGVDSFTSSDAGLADPAYFTLLVADAAYSY